MLREPGEFRFFRPLLHEVRSGAAPAKVEGRTVTRIGERKLPSSRAQQIYANITNISNQTCWGGVPRLSSLPLVTMPVQDDALALALSGLTLAEGEFSFFFFQHNPDSHPVLVSQALHQIADRLGEPAHRPRPNLTDTRSRYYAETDTEYVRFFFNPTLFNIPPTRSTTSSNDRRYSPRRRHPEGHHRSRLEAEPRDHHINADIPDVYASNRSAHRPETASRPNSNRLGATTRFSQDRQERPPRSNADYHDPHRMHISRSEDGHDAQSHYSPSRSLTPLLRASSLQAFQPPSDRRAYGAHVTDQRYDGKLPSSRPRSPPGAQPNNVLGDIFDLDESLVKRRTPDCDTTIHRPPPGSQGSQNRWYFICCGRQVGIYNEWCVCCGCGGTTSQRFYRNDVKVLTDGVRGSHQQRVDNESLAYAGFKRALLQRKVEVSK
jgi:hypothetical protein